MTVSARKITAFAKLVAGLADTPNLGSTTLLKQWFDSSPEELRVSINGLIDDLIATAAGASGTEQIGSAAISGVAGLTAYAQLVDLKAQLNGVVLGQIPPDLLTNSLYRQAIINGNFDVWQRGTNFSSPGYNAFTADRYSESGDGTLGTYTISRQAFIPGQTVVPNNPKYFYRHDQTVAGTGQTFKNFLQKIENGSLFAGSTFTISFYAKADSARTVSVSAFRNYGTGGSPSTQDQLGNSAISLTTSWQKFTLVVTAPSVSGKTFGTNGDDNIPIVISMPINTTFTMDIAQIQVNSGNTALPSQPKSFADELAACQRYYEKSYNIDIAPATASVSLGIELKVVPSNSITNLQPYGNTRFKVKKRVNPTVTIYPFATPSNTGRVSDNSLVDLGVNSGTPTYVNTDGFTVYNSSGVTYTTVSNAVVYHWAADSEL